MKKTSVIILFLICSNMLWAQNPLKIIQSQICLLHKDTTCALQLLSDTIQQNPKAKLAQKMRGNIYFTQKNYDKALGDYLHVFSNGDSSILYNIILCYAKQKDVNNTVKWLKTYLTSSSKLPENVIRTNPDFSFLSKQPEWEALWKKNWFNDLEVHLGEIYYLYEQKDINTLIETIETLLKSYPNEERLLLWRAKSYLLAANSKESLKSVDILLQKNPSNREAIQLKEKIYETDANYKMLAQTYIQHFNAEPWNMELLVKIPAIFNNAEQYKESIIWSKRYIPYDTANAEIYYQLGVALSNTKDYLRAVEALSQSLQLYKGNSDCYFERGKCNYELAAYDKAYFDFCMALDLTPTVGEYFYYRGLTSYAMKKTIGACRDFERAKQYGFMKAESYIQRFCHDK